MPKINYGTVEKSAILMPIESIKATTAHDCFKITYKNNIFDLVTYVYAKELSLKYKIRIKVWHEK